MHHDSQCLACVYGMNFEILLLFSVVVGIVGMFFGIIKSLAKIGGQFLFEPAKQREDKKHASYKTFHLKIVSVTQDIASRPWGTNQDCPPFQRV